MVKGVVVHLLIWQVACQSQGLREATFSAPYLRDLRYGKHSLAKGLSIFFRQGAPEGRLIVARRFIAWAKSESVFVPFGTTENFASFHLVFDRPYGT